MTLPIVRPSSSFGHRVATRVARSALGIMVVRKVGSRIDPALIRLTGGRLSSVAPFPAMLLTHTGAKSGVTRTSTVVYFTDADRVIVIASNFGAPHRPAWYYNVKAHPEVTLSESGFGSLFTPKSWWVRNATGFSNSLLSPPRRTTTISERRDNPSPSSPFTRAVD